MFLLELTWRITTVTIQLSFGSYVFLQTCVFLTVSVETVLTIVYQQQAVFRIRPVNRCSQTIAGMSYHCSSTMFQLLTCGFCFKS